MEREEAILMLIPKVIALFGSVFFVMRLADIYLPPFLTWCLTAFLDWFQHDERRAQPRERRPRFSRGCASLPRPVRQPMQPHVGIDAVPRAGAADPTTKPGSGDTPDAPA